VFRSLGLVLLAFAACRKETPSAPDAGPSREVVDAGIDPACEGLEVPFARVFDPRCGVGGRAFDALVDAGVSGLVVIAKRDGAAVAVTFANPTEAPLDVPFRAHPGREDLAPFLLLAEDEAHGVYELRPPRLDGIDAGARVHSARIRLPPGGKLRARLEVDASIARRVDRADAAPQRLSPGHYVLHVEALGVPFELPVVRVAWDVSP
jgi:hypothetical protein